MRIHLVAALALVLPACAGDITSPGGNTGGPACGNGVVDTGEQCDDGNTAAGDGCSATCTMEQAATPKLDIALDHPTISTELMTANKINVTLTASGGFSGTVNLTATAVDSTNAALTGWTIAFDNASVNVPENGTATAVATVTIPSQNMGLSGTVNIQAESSLGTVMAPSAITVANQLTFAIQYDPNNGCVYPADWNLVQVTVGSKVRFLSMAATPQQIIAIHSNNPVTGICHEAQPGVNGCPAGDQATPNTLAPNDVYEQTAVATGTVKWYCHTPGNDNGDTIQVVN
jgi:cysteine-rich repeat protein